MPLSAITTYSGLFLAVFQISAGAIIPRASPEFGNCGRPDIAYKNNNGGVEGWSYVPNRLKDYNHNPDQLIKPIAEFICSTLQNKCKAPKATNDLCVKATAATNGTHGQAAADAFNAIMIPDSTSPAQTSSAAPSATAAPGHADSKGKYQPRVSVKFSSETVEFPGKLDPIWWYNKYIISADKQTCDESSVKMPEKHYLSFQCEGAEDKTIELMRTALNAAVTATIENTTLSENERFFKYTKRSEQRCVGGTYPSCAYVDVDMTVVPQAVHISVANNVPVADAPGGQMGFLQGNLRYQITKSASNQCAVCSFFGSGGGASAATAGIAAAVDKIAKTASPGISLLSSLVTIACLAGCS